MSLIIYLVAFLEWFTTLSVEIVAIRNFTPIIWTNSISTSIILWIILLALSYWYYIWWKLSENKDKIKKRLVANLIIASLYYFFISFIFSWIILEFFLENTWSYFFSILFSSIILFFIPVFLASQTIPLLSELLKWKNSWEKIWKLLFYSTIGSFIGSISTSSFLFPLIWVFKTWILSSIILIFCSLLITFYFIKNTRLQIILTALLIFLIFFTTNFSYITKAIYKEANAYHNIDIFDYNDKSKRIFMLDSWYSSWINLKDKKSFFNYIIETKKKLESLKSKNILVIWAAWFTFPEEASEYDFVKNIDVIDVDPRLKDITEKYFLEKKLSKKIKFYPIPTRYFLNQKLKEKNFKKYDFIFIDAYSGKNPPPQLLTLEFFEQLNKIWNNIHINIILDSKLNNDYTKNIFSTINKTFKKTYYKNLAPKSKKLTNIIITNNFYKEYEKNIFYNENIYTDDKNSIELDIFKMKNYTTK